jgi:alpha-beta hydrolase superfamily lysophospholipase
MRAVRALLLVLVVLALLFYAGGGWYFAGQIEADALLVEDDEPDPNDVRVASVDGSSIGMEELADSDGQVHNDGLYGLSWAGGYGRLGDGGTERAEVLTRPFTLLDGSPPAAGTEADVTSYAYPEDPGKAFGVPAQNVKYESPLGPMDAWFVPGASTHWAILLHGRAAERSETLRPMKAFIDAGLPVLSIAYRNDPGQPRDPSGYYRFGFTEWEDLEGAVRYAKDHGAAGVTLFGMSTGGAIAVSFMERSEMASEVKGIGFDSPNLDFGAAISQEASERTLPVVGLPIPESLVGAAKILAELRYDIEFDDLDYVPGAGELEVPMLVLHGTADKTIPIEVSRRLAESAGPNLRLVEFPEVGHVRSWNVDPARYEQEISQFISTVTG